MGYASKLGRASISSRNPRAAGQCDRCGFIYTHSTLQWQYDYAGAGLINKRILVCDECMDTPQAQLRAIVLPADPVPIQNPRVQDYYNAETTTIAVQYGAPTDPTTGIPIYPIVSLINSGGLYPTSSPIGLPTGLDQNAVQPLFLNVHYRVNLNPLSVLSDGTTTITVTCPQAHGLANNDQIAAQGLSNTAADGFYSITVTSATAFTYQANVNVSATNLLQGTTLVVTALVGLPYGYAQIPQPQV